MSKFAQSTQEFVTLLTQGADAWNRWRAENPGVTSINLEDTELQGLDLLGADLRGVALGWASLGGTNLGGADLRGADLTNANLSGANLGGANLAGSNLFKAVLREAKLYKAHLKGVHAKRANFYKADLSEADLTNAILTQADMQESKLHRSTLVDANLERTMLGQADLRGANLRGANLSRCRLIEVVLDGGDISGCRVYGTSAWDVQLNNTKQSNLLITPEGHPDVTVDDLEVAQFIYLILNNEKIRVALDNVSRKMVLILGRFSDEHKPVLDGVAAALRTEDYLPVIFDWEKPEQRSMLETVGALAHMARFVIVDITDPKRVPDELARIVTALPSVPVQPIIKRGDESYELFKHYDRYPWFMDVIEYTDIDDLTSSFATRVLAPSEKYLRAH